MPPKRPAASQPPDMPHAPGGRPATTNGDEFTQAVRKRLATSTRTGQACDRCKVRKIRCDGLPEGCSPCRVNNTECKTTDRISQKAIPRGHLESLEKRCAELEAQNKELQAALALQFEQRNGGSFVNQEWDANGNKSGRPYFSDHRWAGDHQGSSNISPYLENGGNTPPVPISRTPFRPMSTATHYLGMSAGNSYLNSMKDTALKLLGIEVDLSVLDPADPQSQEEASLPIPDDDQMLKIMFNQVPRRPAVPLPEYQEAMRLINYFFTISHPYLPILHKPSFMKLVERVYSRDYNPTAAQIVQVHMVLAIVHYQTAAFDRFQNHGQIMTTTSQLYARSRTHYEYAMSLMYHLLDRPTLEDVQAIGLILQHKRSFPKPGTSWLLSRMAIALCVDLGLHRSPSKLPVDPRAPPPNSIEIELRKRVFWCILTLESSLASKLGRPMSIREGDYDVEFPEAMEDDNLTETGIIKRQETGEECTYDIALCLFRYTMLGVEIHSRLYGATGPSRENYVTVVEDLERRLTRWRERSLKIIPINSEKDERRFQAAHLESWYHEARILMRHPSLASSPSPTFMNDSVKICVESSRAILRLTNELRQGQHYLDTTWYGATLQLVATLTILFSLWNKGEAVTAEEKAVVKKDMELAMDIMGDLGALLGAPNRLRDVVRVLTNGTMEMLKKRENHSRSASTTSQSRGSPPENGSYSGAPSSYTPTTTAPATIPSMRVASSQSPQANQFTAASYPTPTQPAASYSPTDQQEPFYDTTSAPPNPAFTTPTTYAENPQSFSWSWSGSEAWRQYMQGLTSLNNELDPSETYASSALIALNQDCNNGFLANEGVIAANVAAAQAAVTQHQQQQQQAQVQQVQGAGEQQNSPPWPIAIGGYQYAGDVRGGDTGGQEGQ